MERIPTGIEELDEIIKGGYPKGKLLLITGTPGAGKTIYGIHLLHKSCNSGKKCTLIATEETPQDILMQAEVLGLELKSYVDSGNLIIERVFESRTESVEQADQFGTGLDIMEIGILERVKMVPEDTDVVVIDNLGVYALDIATKDFRNLIDTINRILTNKGITTLIIMDETANELTHNVAEYSAYSSMKIMIKDNPYTSLRERYLDIIKMRSTHISLELSLFDITSKGIRFSILKRNVF
ncbi:MAG: ATPase domain-containing protein [Methanosarcinaceae archaeon]|nr:ATPase domain-containing protein [Methanosarcinaceae archaeon]